MFSSRSGQQTSVAGLLAANAVPLVGVLALGWDLGSLLVIYWLESAAVGGLSVLKMLRAEGEDRVADLPSMSFNDRSVGSFVGKSNRTIALFFLNHYGVFWIVHGVFVGVFTLAFPEMGPLRAGTIAFAAVSLAAYHAISYRTNFVGAHEYEHTEPVTLMVEPYRRVFVLHITIVLGGFAIASIGGPVGALVVMVLTKTGLDLYGHWKEHDRARTRTTESTRDG